MNIYFSGIGGVGIGPLAEIAHDAGHFVVGSDSTQSLMTNRLDQKGIPVSISTNDNNLRERHATTPFDWFVHTAALPANHPELVLAAELGIRVAKRDEFLAEFVSSHNLKMIAVTGTHGKTTTTGMAVWAFKQLGIPVSYSVGSTLSFGPSGHYHPDSEYFVYECDEYDRNFLHFSPHFSIITSIDYDHPDTYPTEDSYKEAFRDFVSQSAQTIGWRQDLDYIQQEEGGLVKGLEATAVHEIQLAGEHNRRNATLVVDMLSELIGEDEKQLIATIESFPGTDRRFEKLADGIYSDYGHHPEEIAATLQMATELSDDITLVYQPHQNLRQHFIKNDYTTQFEKAKTIFWLPTYLTREDESKEILSPQELTTSITNKQAIIYADLNDPLWNDIIERKDAGSLVLFMGAGSIDQWARNNITKMVSDTQQ